MRTAFKHLKNQQGFTLLELLVVVAILAVVAGGLVVAYDGLENQAAQQEASHGLAALNDAVRIFTSIEGAAPNNMDSLLAATPVGGTQVTTITQGSEAAVATLSNIGGKVTATVMTAAQVGALNKAGITQARYIDLKGNVLAAAGTCSPSCTIDTFDAGGAAASVGPIDLIDIPVRMFDLPRDGAGNNRGRGYTSTIATTDKLMVWNKGVGGENNIKIGGKAAGSIPGGTTFAADDDVLVVFGLGNNTSMFTSDAVIGTANLSGAPTYPNAARFEYARYNAVYNVGTINTPLSRAKLVTIVDSKGDFLDEELAEASGQKS